MEYEFDGRRARYSDEMPVDAYTGQAIVLKIDIEPWVFHAVLGVHHHHQLPGSGVGVGPEYVQVAGLLPSRVGRGQGAHLSRSGSRRSSRSWPR